MGRKMNWGRVQTDRNMNRWGSDGPGKRLTRWEEQTFEAAAMHRSAPWRKAPKPAVSSVATRAAAVNEARVRNGLPPIRITGTR